MNVAIQNMITGVSEASQDAGRHPGWPNEKIAASVIAKIASEWTGPELLYWVLKQHTGHAKARRYRSDREASERRTNVCASLVRVSRRRAV